MLEGSLERPQKVLIEVIDFFLMDIGSGAHTQFSWGADLTEYYEENPHLMEDGIRTGVLHSHHSMGTFFSGEDVDDLVINTRDKEVDYYLSVIVNNKGEWISRLAFRIEETVEEKIKMKFFSKVTSFKGWKHATRTRQVTVLCMLPLTVEDEGQGSNTKRLKAMEAKKEAESRPSYYGRGYEEEDYHRPWQGYNGKQIELGLDKIPHSVVSKEEEEKVQRVYDILLGRVFSVNLTYDGGLDAAVRSFRSKVVSPFNKQPLEATIMIHCEHVCANAHRVIAATEGYDVTPSYVLEVLDDLQDTLTEDYMEEEDLNAIATEGAARQEKGEIEIFVDALNLLIERMDLDTDQKTKPETNGNGNGNKGNTSTTHPGAERHPRTF